MCDLRVKSTLGYKNPAVHVQYARTILMMKFTSCALYAVPRLRVKSEVYFCLDSLMRRSEERSVFRIVSTSFPPLAPLNLGSYYSKQFWVK